MTHSFPTRRSSDLTYPGADPRSQGGTPGRAAESRRQICRTGARRRPECPSRRHGPIEAAGEGWRYFQGRASRHLRGHTERSEEHTSELQSLMRISYAVFCLKKKKKKHNKTL